MFRIDYPFSKEILACGAQHQANFCLTKKNSAYVINDLGSLNESQAWERYQSEIERLKNELKVKPKVISCDLHPEYNSTKYARDLSQKSKGLKNIAIQHQHAHLASCIGENRLTGKVIGVVFDAPGFGEDGNDWGGEFFLGDLQGFRRVGHLNYTSHPKGVANPVQAARQLAFDFLYQAFGEGLSELPIDFIRHQQKENWQTLKQGLNNSAYSSSAAQLFDAVSVLVGLRERLEYSGQGVSDLERIINRSSHVANRTYEFAVKQQNGLFLVHPELIFQGIVEDLKKNTSKSIISAVFHNTIIEMIGQLCHGIKQKEKIKTVILTGTVFQNKTLFNRVKELLTQDGFKVVEHLHFPCNDSNISFGQAVLANVK
ncbi:MAG: carbamoyltransferase HypF [Candidatus Omnitrophica bacterium]|nr:carbamoyltransferase HypF [Candidatus Omnitrophota bacterium]